MKGRHKSGWFQRAGTPQRNEKIACQGLLHDAVQRSADRDGMDGYTRRCDFSSGSAQGFNSPRLHAFFTRAFARWFVFHAGLASRGTAPAGSCFTRDLLHAGLLPAELLPAGSCFATAVRALFLGIHCHSRIAPTNLLQARAARTGSRFSTPHPIQTPHIRVARSSRSDIGQPSMPSCVEAESLQPKQKMSRKGSSAMSCSDAIS